jgi:hypothetical protein
MKKVEFLISFLLLCPLWNVPAQQSGQPLTNDSIVKLVKAGLSEDTVVSIVNTQPGKYSLGADDIMALKKAGLPQKVIAAMLNKSPAGQPAPSQNAKPKPGLAGIHKVFIKGNNEAATTARDGLIKRAESGGASCLGLLANEGTADGTLEISQETAPDGTVTVSGNLADHEGNVLWSDSKHALGPAGAAAFLLVSLLNQACPPRSLSNVRKIQVVDPGHLKKGVWISDCLTFVEKSADADAVLLPKESGGKMMWALLDPRGSTWIPGWETDSFPDVKELEKAVGCPGM